MDGWTNLRPVASPLPKPSPAASHSPPGLLFFNQYEALWSQLLANLPEKLKAHPTIFHSILMLLTVFIWLGQILF